MGSLGCDVTVDATTAGAQSSWSNYPSFDCGDFNVGGPEAIYTFSAGSKWFVKVWETDSSNITLYLLSDCDPVACFDYGFSEVTFTADAGSTHYIAGEGFSGAVDDFSLHTLCIDPGGCPDGKVPTCGGACQWGHWYADGQCNTDFKCAELGWDGGDCDPT